MKSKEINDVIKSQNYEGEIEDLIVYALVTIFLFFVIGYIGTVSYTHLTLPTNREV